MDTALGTDPCDRRTGRVNQFPTPVTYGAPVPCHPIPEIRHHWGDASERTVAMAVGFHFITERYNGQWDIGENLE